MARASNLLDSAHAPFFAIGHHPMPFYQLLHGGLASDVFFYIYFFIDVPDIFLYVQYCILIFMVKSLQILLSYERPWHIGQFLASLFPASSLLPSGLEITSLYPFPCTLRISTELSALRCFLSLVMYTSMLRALK